MDIKIKVIPNSSINKVLGFEENTLKIKLTALPEKGLANKALIELLSKKLKVSKSAISILKGESSSSKILRIDGFTKEDIIKVIGEIHA